MPDRDRFDTQAGLYTVLMHELGHWTGHPKRLDRDMSGVDGTPEYWFEELVAELSACFVLAALALPDRMEELPNSASYLKHYLDLLRGDRRKLVKAASLAQKAAAYILSGGKDFSQPGDQVVDPLGGAFTTAVACKPHDRKCISCDNNEAAVIRGQDRLRSTSWSTASNPIA